MHRLLWIPIALATILPAHALEVSGRVSTKLGAPIAGAQVCIKSNPGVCVATGAQGEFSLSGAIAVRPAVHAASRFSLSRRGGSLRVESPAAVSVRVEWLSADGRTRWAVSDQELAAGSNLLALPPGLPHAGLCILRLSTSDETLVWKAVLAPGPAASSGEASSAAPRIAALAKAAAASLEISKTGYRTHLYQPRSEMDTGAVIHLSETADSGMDFSGVQHTRIASIDRIRHWIVTVDSEFHCDPQTDSLVVIHTLDTANYAIRDGRMWLWDMSNCTGSLFIGSASDPVGKWTFAEPDVPLPADLQVGCSPYSGESFSSPLESMSEELTITETGITLALSIGFCPGELIAYDLAWNLFGDSSVVLTRNACMQLEYRNQAGKMGTFSFSKSGDSLDMLFAYAGGTCGTATDWRISDRTHTCPEVSTYQDFLTCVSNAGFGKTAPLMKPASGGTKHGSLRLREYISGTWRGGFPEPIDHGLPTGAAAGAER